MSINDYRLENGVRRRMDGGGDAFANAHRELGNWAYMQDIDTMFGFEAFGKNTSDLLFCEYEPDPFKNSGDMIRNFAMIALFDRKKTRALAEQALYSNRPILTAFYLHQCRLNAAVQPLDMAPKFFFCADTLHGWELLEVDINTGKACGCARDINRENMNSVWSEIGLHQAHSKAAKWLRESGGMAPS